MSELIYKLGWGEGYTIVYR